MSADIGFRLRAKEVRAYLRSLQSLENKHREPGRGFYRGAAAITASRASAFIMIYNCVEYAAREALVELREEIQLNGGTFESIAGHWQEEIIRAQFYDRLRQGTNYIDFLRDVSAFLPGRLDWRTAKRDLPSRGNLDQEEIFLLVRRIGHRWRPPKTSLGGSDLQLVRQMRNDLAHGQESFEQVGALYTTEDVILKFERIRTFMLSFLKMLERYKSRRLYLRT